MNYYAFSALVVLLCFALSGLFVYLKNPHGKKNLTFQGLVIPGVLWSFFYILWQMSTNAQDALLYIRISVAFAAIIPAANFHAIVKILDAESPRRNFFIVFLYVMTGLILLSTPTSYFISRVEPRGGFPFWPVPGPMFHLHLLNLFTPSLWIVYLIWREKEKASALQKNKLNLLLYGVLLAYTGGMSNNLLWYNIPIKPYINILTGVGVVGVALVFFRPAAVDVNFLVRRLLRSLSQFTLLCGAVVLVLSPFLFHLPSPVLVVLAACLGGLGYPLINKLFDRPAATSKLSREKIKESTYTYKDLAQNIVDLTLSTVPVEMAAVYFYDLAHQDFYLCAQKGMKNEKTQNLRYNRSALAIPLSDPLPIRLQSAPDVINIERLVNEMNQEKDRPVVDSLRRLEAEICEPFVFGEKLRGLLVVGKKRNNSLFNDDELEVLNSYSQMGTEVMRTIMAMETELNQTALYSHDINHDIRSITQTLQFLKSPMARSQPEEKIQKLMDQAEKVAEHLYEWFQDNRDRSAMIMKTIRGEYGKEPVRLDEITNLSAGKFRLQAETDHVDYQVSIEPLETKFNGNEADLTHVVDNLISNALRHLPEQGAKLSLTSRKNGTNYEIYVQDNGEGIEPENLEQIWQMGWQGKVGKKGSAGFGLAIVKQIVTIHGGTIQAFSQGKGAGTEFKIVFPLEEIKK